MWKVKLGLRLSILTLSTVFLSSCGVMWNSVSQNSITSNVSHAPAASYWFSYGYLWAQTNNLFSYKYNTLTGEASTIEAPITAGNRIENVVMDPHGHYLLGTDTDGGAVFSYLIDSTTGQLTLVSRYTTNFSSPRFIALHPNRTFFYVTDASNATVVPLQIDPTTAVISSLGAPVSATSAWQPILDPTGSVLFLMGTMDDLSTFTVDSGTGALTPVTGGTPYNNGSFSSTIITDANLKFIYNPGYGPSATVATFKVTAGTGILTAAPGSPFPTAAASLTGYIIDPGGSFFYASDQTANEIYAYQINPDASFSALTPASYTGGGNFYFSPDGKMLVTTGPNGIYSFTFNSSTGALTAASGSPITPATTGLAAAFSPDSKFLYMSSGTVIYGYQTDTTTGSLTLVSTLNASGGAILPLYTPQ